jgi:hypothetical protein
VGTPVASECDQTTGRTLGNVPPWLLARACGVRLFCRHGCAADSDRCSPPPPSQQDRLSLLWRRRGAAIGGGNCLRAVVRAAGAGGIRRRGHALRASRPCGGGRSGCALGVLFRAPPGVPAGHGLRRCETGRGAGPLPWVPGLGTSLCRDLCRVPARRTLGDLPGCLAERFPEIRHPLRPVYAGAAAAMLLLPA